MGVERSCRLVLFVAPVSMTPNLFEESEIEVDGGGRALDRTVKSDSTQFARKRVDIILPVRCIESV